MAQRSATCKSHTGKYVMEYFSKEEAQEAADYAAQRSHQNLVPYKCSSCDFWHLAPQERQIDSAYRCSCCDHQGKPKKCYATKKDAERQVILTKKERGKNLHIYKCPLGAGFHLSSHY